QHVFQRFPWRSGLASMSSSRWRRATSGAFAPGSSRQKDRRAPRSPGDDGRRRRLLVAAAQHEVAVLGDEADGAAARGGAAIVVKLGNRTLDRAPAGGPERVLTANCKLTTFRCKKAP